MKSLTQEDFSQLSHILPSHLQSPQIAPAEVLKFIIEEFKDSKLFSLSKSFTKIKASALSKSQFSESLDLSKPSAFIEIIWDVCPTLTQVLNILEKLEKSVPLELLGMIAARGCYYSAFVKSKSSWKSFEDGRIHNWQGLMCGLLSGMLYPVLLYVRGSAGPGNFLQDLEKLKEFAKIQDSKMQFVWKEESANETYSKHSEVECRATTRDLYKESWGKEREYEKPVSDNLRYRYYSTQPEGFYKQKTEDFGKLTVKDLEGGKADNGESAKYNLNKSLQMSFKVVDNEKGQMPEIKMVALNSSGEAIGGLERLNGNINYTEIGSRTYKVEPKLYNNEPQILKNDFSYKQENTEYRKDSQFYQTAPQTYRTESSLLKKDPETYKDPEIYKKGLDFYVQEFTPKITESSKKPADTHRRMAESCKKIAEAPKKDNFFPYSTASNLKTQENKFVNSCSADGLKRETGDWNCPKCSGHNIESVYECSSCRFINWDRFYSIKAQNLPNRSGNFQVKPAEVYSRLYRTPPSDDRDSDLLDYNGRSTALDFNRAKGYWDEDRKRNGKPFYFNQYN